MFSALFNMQIRPDRMDRFDAFAASLREDAAASDGFIGLQFFRSLTRPGSVLAIYEWRDADALARWGAAQNTSNWNEGDRDELLQDYRVRAGQNTVDSAYALGELPAPTFAPTKSTKGTDVTVIVASNPPGYIRSEAPNWCAKWLGLDIEAPGLGEWEVLEGIDTTNSVMLLAAWANDGVARDYEAKLEVPEDGRLRRVRLMRDYGMFDQAEAPNLDAQAN